MTAQKLNDFLKNKKIKYVTITHSPAYTAQDISMLTHIPSDTMAKSVIVSLGKDFAMVVIPGNKKIDIESLKKTAHEDEARIASESEFKNQFSDCEVGAMPPFGNLYGMKVYVDDGLSSAAEIGFNAGSHSEIMKMSYKDYDTLVHPVHGKFTQ